MTRSKIHLPYTKNGIWINSLTVFLSFQGILAIFVGIALGIAWGVLCDYIPDHSDYYAPTIRSILIFGGGFLLTYAGGYVGWGGVCEYHLNHTIICVQRSKETQNKKKIYSKAAFAWSTDSFHHTGS